MLGVRNYYCYTLIFSDRFDVTIIRAVFDRPYGFFWDRKAVQSFHSDTALFCSLFGVCDLFGLTLSFLTPHSSFN